MIDPKNLSKEDIEELQQAIFCEVLGDWYLEWKNKIVDYKNETHLLGCAKEDLKTRVCKLIEDGKL